MVHIKTRDLEGRDHYVVPVVMAVEGVLNGNNGPLFYPGTELKKSALLWNGRPVLLYHPDLYTSSYAGNPRVFDKQKLGTIFNAKFASQRLLADAWLETGRLDAIAPRVLRSIQTKQQVEVSTGLLIEVDGRTGIHNGRAYIGIARNHLPDHLAILPDKVGACSLKDGCGLIRNEEPEILQLPALEF